MYPVAQQHQDLHATASGCQYAISITGIVIGILFALCGVFAYCSINGCIPPKPIGLKAFSIIGLKNSYFVMGGGAALTMLSTASTIYLLKLSGERDHAPKKED